jgi:hypothetical protein
MSNLKKRIASHLWRYIFCVISGFLMAAVASADEEKKSKSKNEEVPNAAYYKLESTFVGDKEQPAVSYFIPWKGTSTPDKLQWNLDVKYDQTLDLVDRDVVLRSMNIYDEMNLENIDTQSVGAENLAPAAATE